MLHQKNMLILALNALQAPLVQRCQKVLNNISTQYIVGVYWVPGHAGV